MNKLSKRERVLLYILLLFVIFAAGLFLLVQPSIQRYDALDVTLADKTMEQALRRAAISGAAQSERAIADYREKLKAGYADFYEPMTNEDIDRLITGMLEKHQLTPVSLSVPGTLETSVEPYQPEHVDDIPDTAVAAAEGLVCSVTATVDGAMQSLTALAEEVRAAPQLTLTGFSRMDTNNQFTVTIDVYLFEHLD